MFETELYRLDDLQNGYSIYQDTRDFCFGIDAVLLSDFAEKRMKNNSKVMDLCTGNGIIPLLLKSRNSTLKITANEILDNSARLAKYNFEYNNTDIELIHCDANKIDNIHNGRYDYVTINPPYMAVGRGEKNEQPNVSCARHETHFTLEEISYVCAKMLKDKGDVFMVHRVNRLSEIFVEFRKFKLEIKQIRYIHSKYFDSAKLCLISAKKNSGAWLEVLPPLYVYKDNDTYTDEILEIYGGNIDK